MPSIETTNNNSDDTYNACHEECLEWVLGAFFDLLRIPHSDFPFQFVRHLFGFFSSASFETFLTCLNFRGWRRVFWILNKIYKHTNQYLCLSCFTSIV